METGRPPAIPRPPDELEQALGLLGKRRLVLSIHDQSFPSLPGDDTGRGTPYSAGGKGLLHFARSLGFNGLQLGPQGQTSRINPSPYDGSLFSRNFLSIDLRSVADDPRWAGLLRRRTLENIVEHNPRPDGKRVPYAYVFDAYCAALGELCGRYLERLQQGDPAARSIDQELAAFRTRHGWLYHDALYEALCTEHGHIHWRTWPQTGAASWDHLLCCPAPQAEDFCAARRADIEARHRRVIVRYELSQLSAQRQHEDFQRLAASWGVKLYGDVQVGMSPRDTWSRQRLLLAGYRLGAPPSRTNPEGQPWNHAVFDPEQYWAEGGKPGPVLRFLSERLGKMLQEFDGLRIDHPHGLVCPWVYRADDPDAFHAVQNGARLFASPGLAEHPGLGRYAIVGAHQLSQDVGTLRHGDHWVRTLDAAQVERYAVLMDALVAEARARGRETDDILCEVLSTQPYPLARVMERHRMGRFRVTQKARLDDPHDVYRSESARPEDWIMAGNHDTPPIWRLARSWHGSAEGKARASHLARRLRPDGGAEALAEELAADPWKLVDDVYNVPGTVSEHNWTLRVPSGYLRDYPAQAARGEALNLPYALALALRSRGAGFAAEHRALIARLQVLAAWRAPGSDS
jgi:4-alpha-glucanotransferase